MAFLFLNSSLICRSQDIPMEYDARISEHVQSIPEEKLLNVFSTSILDRHGKPDAFYDELLKRDSKGSIKNEILRLIELREDPKSSRQILVVGGGPAVYLASKYYGHEAKVRTSLLQVVEDANVWSKSINSDYETNLMVRSPAVTSVLFGLAKNPNVETLTTIETIGQRCQLVSGSRVDLYMALGRRYNAFKSEKDAILAMLKDFLEDEANTDIFDHLATSSDFKKVGEGLNEKGIALEIIRSRNKVAGSKVLGSGISAHEAKADHAKENLHLWGRLLWPALFLSIGIMSLVAILALSNSRRNK